jgi:ABC-type Zn2+ transport system substrate-binding protein/surface adhesin
MEGVSGSDELEYDDEDEEEQGNDMNELDDDEDDDDQDDDDDGDEDDDMEDDEYDVDLSTVMGGGVPKGKKGGADLYKLPTNEEIQQLKDTTDLFQSNLFKLQVRYCLHQKT